MSLGQRCANAIRQVGGTAAIVRDDRQMFFPASIQPVSGGMEEQADALGWGFTRRYNLFAPCGSNADELLQGDTVTYLDNRYFVRWVDKVYVQNEAVYIRGLLQMEEGDL